MGCEINILRLTETISKRMKEQSGKKIWTLFIDLKSAFDTVDHAIMFEKMRKHNIKESIVNTIKWLY